MQVILHTEPNPEDNAMIQALYSRSPASVVDHIEKVKQVGSGKFMSTYYLGYGHPSIADCGFVTMYFEGISILAAKALEDTSLFNGQECSTRYIDFSKQLFYNPAQGEKYAAFCEDMLERWRTFYVDSKPILIAHLKTVYPDTGDKPAVYEKTIAARAFDILRGALPTAATTNVAWTTSLRKASEHLINLMHHPLDEVQKMAAKAYSLLYAKYPTSFHQRYSGLDLSVKISNSLLQIEGQDLFFALSSVDQFYNQIDLSPCEDWDFSPLSTPDKTQIILLGEECSYPHDSKVRHIPYPKHSVQAQTNIDIYGEMDFGSYRDIQRHRNGYCSNYLVGDIDLGIEEWYVNQLPEELQVKLAELWETFSQFIDIMTDVSNPEDLQYFYPMMTKIPVVLRYTAEQTRYVAELRSGKTVHPTLRPFAQKMGKCLVNWGFKCDYDTDENNWTLKRGTQDIVSKTDTVQQTEPVEIKL